MEAARLSSTWMLGQVSAISPFNFTRLVGRLLLMRLFLMFHTSSIMFRSGLLADQSSTWTLRSWPYSCAGVWGLCSSQMLLKNHVFIAIQMPYRSSMDEKRWLSNTSKYTHIGCNCWFEELENLRILSIPLVDAQPHTITKVGNFTDL